MSHDAAIGLVQGVLALGVNLRYLYVDTVGDPERYQAKLADLFPMLQVVVEKKADAKAVAADPKVQEAGKKAQEAAKAKNAKVAAEKKAAAEKAAAAQAKAKTPKEAEAIKKVRARRGGTSL